MKFNQIELFVTKKNALQNKLITARMIQCVFGMKKINWVQYVCLFRRLALDSNLLKLVILAIKTSRLLAEKETC